MGLLFIAVMLLFIAYVAFSYTLIVFLAKVFGWTCLIVGIAYFIDMLL